MLRPANSGTIRLFLFSIIFLLFGAVDFAQVSKPATGKAGAASSASTRATPSFDESKFVGAEACRTCHEEVYDSWEKTAHWKTMLAGESDASHRGCEGCHGSGADHIAGGGDKSRIFTFQGTGRAETNALCSRCHGDGHQQSRFASSAHASANVGCLDCHSPHHAKEEQYLLRQSQPQLCYGCHAAARADFSKPFHHRVNEGLVQCNDCHNVHGTETLRQARTVAQGDAVCFKCHADKQGPFVYEHVPVKTEGCGSCHTPHGSTNPRMLKVSLVNLQCLQCHTLPTQSPIGPAHNQSAKYQACTMCHTQIHGSNFSSVFFK